MSNSQNNAKIAKRNSELRVMRKITLVLVLNMSFRVSKYFEMDVVREIDLSSDPNNSKL